MRDEACRQEPCHVLLPPTAPGTISNPTAPLFALAEFPPSSRQRFGGVFPQNQLPGSTGGWVCSPSARFFPPPQFCFPGAGAGRCRCGRVSQGARESGCRSPGAQEGRAQDTRCLQQRSSEADIKARGRCCRAGEPGPADSPVGTRIPAAPRGREEALGQPHSPHGAQALVFLPLLGRLGAGAGPHRNPQEPWMDAAFPALLQVPSATGREQISPQPGAVCVCRRGQPSLFAKKKSFCCRWAMPGAQQRSLFPAPFFFFPPTHLQSQGSQLQSASPTPAGKPGCARTSPGCSRSWLQFHPPPPTGAGTHNDQVSLGTRCAVPPSPLPARAGEELGSSQNAACPVGRAPRAPGRWQEPGSACPSTHPAPSASANARTHTPSLPR